MIGKYFGFAECDKNFVLEIERVFTAVIIEREYGF